MPPLETQLEQLRVLLTTMNKLVSDLIERVPELERALGK